MEAETFTKASVLSLEQVADILQGLNSSEISRVFEILKQEGILAGCPTYTCKTKNHGHLTGPHVNAKDP